MLNLLPFTEIDWDCYAGCEDKEPLIADDVITITLDGLDYVGQVIVDGFHVAIHLNLAIALVSNEPKYKMEHPFLDEEMTIIKECMTKLFAKADAESIPDKPTTDWLFLRGFKIC